MARPKSHKHPIQARVSPETLARLQGSILGSDTQAAGTMAARVLESWAAAASPEADQAIAWAMSRLQAAITVATQPDLAAAIAACEAGASSWDEAIRHLQMDLAATIAACEAGTSSREPRLADLARQLSLQACEDELGAELVGRFEAELRAELRTALEGRLRTAFQRHLVQFEVGWLSGADSIWTARITRPAESKDLGPRLEAMMTVGLGAAIEAGLNAGLEAGLREVIEDGFDPGISAGLAAGVEPGFDAGLEAGLAGGSI